MVIHYLYNLIVLVYDSPNYNTIRIKPLKARHNVTKLDLIVPLLSFWCIDIDLNI